MVDINSFLDDSCANIDEPGLNIDSEYPDDFNRNTPIKGINGNFVIKNKKYSLTLEEISDISEKIIVDNGFSKDEFEEIKLAVMNVLIPGFKRYGIIYSPKGLSNNICSKINKSLKNNQILIENKTQIKAEILLVICHDRIVRFIELLKKSEVSGKWTITGVVNNSELDKNEKIEFESLAKWLRNNIKFFDKKTRKLKVNWGRILLKLKNMGVGELADGFTTIRESK